MKALTEEERIDLLIANLENGMAKKFAEKIGVAPSNITRLRSGEYRLDKFKDRIMAAYPQVSRTWLDTGLGYPGDLSASMIKDRLTDEIAEKDKLIGSLRRELDTQRKVIDRLLKEKK